MQKRNNIIEKMNGIATMVAGRITQSWRLIAAGAAFLFLISIGLVVFAFMPHKTETVATANQESTQQATSTEIFARALDGAVVADASSTRLLPYAVMVENSADAWPLSGPSKANIVIEAPVEGSITRFMLLFDPSSTTTQIGPVRSARPYYVELANGIGALYAHVGGSPDALDLLKTTPHVKNIDEFYNGSYFWRSDSRSAPHNVYTSIDRLTRVASNTHAEAFEFTPWNYSDAFSSSSTISSIEIPYQGIYRASWKYDDATHLYRRSQNNHTQNDADGSTVNVSNVVVMLTDEQVLDEKGRLKVRTTGTGRALLFRDGTVQQGVWRRSAGEHVHFETDDGRDMLFARGKTWISIVTDDAGFEKILH